MGQFNLDELLKELAEPHPDAPREPGDAVASRPVEPPPVFVRNNPADTPRPPDPSGRGLGDTVPAAPAAAQPDAGRIRPTDALAPLYSPDLAQRGPLLDLGQVLLKNDVIKPDQLANAVRVMKQTPGKRLVSTLLEMGVDEHALQQGVAEVARLPFERVDFTADNAVDAKAFKRLGADYCKANLVLPLRREGARMVVGTTRPEDVFLLDEVRRKLGVLSIRHVLVAATDVRGVIETSTEEQPDNQEYDVNEILADVDEDDVEVVKEEKGDDNFAEEAESSPVVRYVNHIIQTAVKEGASDIHIEPGEKKLKVRFRIDGVLFEMMNPPWKMQAALTSRIKIMANLDIAERRLPQDGRIRATVLGRKLDLRVSTLPSAHGEKVVMRILDNRSIQVSLDQLGFEQDTLTIWKNQIDQPHGIILVTGPTGSGKTTTLYASLRQMDTQRLNVSTVEDPVEYNLAGITQTQTHERIGMTFATALKALLRQDPDVIMVGEIRDMDTATIAIQAALTGHLVLSTLHTVNASQTVERIIDMYPAGQQNQIRSMLSNTLQAVVSQTLFSRIDKPGMVPAIEVLLCTPAVRNLIRENRTFEIPNVIDTNRALGMISLDNAIAELYFNGMIGREDAIAQAAFPDKLERQLAA